MANEYADAVCASAKTMLGWPYKLGGVTKDGIDCRGLVRRAFRLVGLIDLIGGPLMNVRQFVAWAKANGRFRDATTTPERGWVIFYYNIDGGGAGPDHLQHMGIVLRPKSKRWPKGRVISAVIPKVIIHALDPFKSLDIFGYLEPAWPVVVEPAINDPEPAVSQGA